MKIRVYSVHVYIVCAHWPNSSVLNFRFFVHFLICYVLFCHLSLVLGLSCQIKIGTLESIVDDFFFEFLRESTHQWREEMNKKKMCVHGTNECKEKQGVKYMLKK